MDHAAVVGVLQRSARLNAVVDRLLPIEASSGLQFIFETAAVHQLHRVVEIVVLLAEAVEPYDIRVAQLAQRLDLGLEAVAKPIVMGQRHGEQLDRGGLAGFGHDRLEDGAHAAAAQLAADLVRSKLLDGHKRSLRFRGSRPYDRRSLEGELGRAAAPTKVLSS